MWLDHMTMNSLPLTALFLYCEVHTDYIEGSVSIFQFYDNEILHFPFPPPPCQEETRKLISQLPVLGSKI